MLTSLLFVAALVVAGSAGGDDLVTDMVGLGRFGGLAPVALWVPLEDFFTLLLVVPAVSTVGRLLDTSVFVTNRHSYSFPLNKTFFFRLFKNLLHYGVGRI